MVLDRKHCHTIISDIHHIFHTIDKTTGFKNYHSINCFYELMKKSSSFYLQLKEGGVSSTIEIGLIAEIEKFVNNHNIEVASSRLIAEKIIEDIQEIYSRKSDSIKESEPNFIEKTNKFISQKPAKVS